MIQELFGLKGKTALVVGASKGLGKAMALSLAGAGADVAVASRSLELIEETRDEISASGRKSLAVKTDIAKEKDIARMVDQVIDGLGKIDILVNNAGIYVPGKALDVTGADWDKTFNVNLKGLFLCCRMVGKHMVEQKRGKIINIASVLGKRAARAASAYSSSKAAIIQLTRSLAFELAPYHINAIAPGWFETEMVEAELGNPKTRKFFLSKTPLRRFGAPEELGGAVIFLASKASDFMTGETIFIDGGISIW
ncbi:MAG: glucose 1-dehydrogenase [Deltaproteobacteria bacterium]|nr:glucose 1-dehydrogenase [Deltaproteobacteria bacterium]MBW2008190.1 glucose 1-dehydrogenase [Deltaproteobacteria bacterium]